MSRTTIDYGIDLGTTNSSIAMVSGAGTEVIKNNIDADITPSAVYINRAGNLWVGQNARSKTTDERTEDDVFLEFKRRMGTGFEYVFRASGRRMRPEDLSAEVLKSLRADVAQKKGEELNAAVITVPAAFELHQCDATKVAAELAGFKTAALLQEPVAAALAYGFQKIDAKAYWLVFDFGGGTFDAALIRSQDGSMVVANHGGDNFLGGSDIDWAIIEQILAPRVAKEFRVDGFKRGAAPYKYDLLRLKAATESAKIELSRKDSTYLEATLRMVANETMTFETEITRSEIAKVAEPIVAKAVKIARRVLSEKRVDPSAVEKLIFVGGPTLAPYFRDLVREQLSIPIDHSVDPLTVVARGAAIFAGTQRLNVKQSASSGSSRMFPVELIYKPVGADLEPLIGGKVSAPGGCALNGFTIELINQQSKWRSGKVALRETGAFQFAVRAEKGVQNVFQIELRNDTGSLCETVPDHLKYTLGVVVEEQPIINNMGVAMSDNKVGVHFTKGQGLPAKNTKTYRTAVDLRQGQSGSVIRIPIVEGNRNLADRNVLIGALEIWSDKIKRDLPAGSEIEVSLHMDTSRILTVIAYVPLLDEEFPTRIELGGKVRQPNLEVLRAELDREKKRLAELKAAKGGEDKAMLAKLDALASSPLVQGLDRALANQGADFDALLKADRELLEFKIQLDDIAELIEWPASVKEADGWLNDLEALVAQQGSIEEKTRAKSLREQVRIIIEDKNADRLRKKMEEISDVYSSILYRQSTFWEGHFNALAESAPQMRETARAEALIRQGRACLDSDNLAELKNVVFQLQDLLPRKVVERAQRGYGSTLVC
ncbi:MAG TPA: Hsp70 family protein [Opitutaceae bacterium]|jgi:molecular chaperone DnaK|nr:Hsp70 family protein [Opitutaceae bacterium]OQB96955.1 MAG: Chaperone protein DnaK [Verrucomicrobia bacterium ADurb.Bin122]MBP8961705.1 Hsp70 family protein [Opitutaceae bacterium]HOD46462.1 Hsp70 family protein [Opitutaceae bacterium]HOY55094.1 Hsp70 family protein [Opitutaceae bacterium]